MPDSRKARRIARPRTAAGAHITGVVSYHAGLRRVDGVGYQTQLAPGGHVILDFDWHSRHRALILWHYTRNRNLMDVTNSDFSQFHVVRDKFLIPLAVLSLAILFAVTHIHQLIVFIERVA